MDVGPELTKNELFDLAEAKFTSAIGSAQTAGNDEILNMSLVGRARTRLNLGNLPDAAADATSVPIDFVKYATASGIDPRRENRVFVNNNRSALFTVGEVYRDFAFQGTPDPRVPVMNTGTTGSNQLSDWWVQQKYTSEDSPHRHCDVGGGTAHHRGGRPRLGRPPGRRRHHQRPARSDESAACDLQQHGSRRDHGSGHL